MTIDYQGLADELLQDHPVTGPYSVDNATAAAELNAANIEVNRTVLGSECADATDADEFNALSDAKQQLWVSLCNWSKIDLNGGIGLATAQGIWAGAAGANTRPALIALRTTFVSRTSQINLGALEFNEGHVAYARSLP